jgi:hypothetical protein
VNSHGLLHVEAYVALALSEHINGFVIFVSSSVKNMTTLTVCFEAAGVISRLGFGFGGGCCLCMLIGVPKYTIMLFRDKRFANEKKG